MTKMTNNNNTAIFIDEISFNNNVQIPINVGSNNYLCKFCGHQLHIKRDKVHSFAGTLIDRISVNCPKCHIRIQKDLWKDNELMLPMYQTIMLLTRQENEK